MGTLIVHVRWHAPTSPNFKSLKSPLATVHSSTPHKRPHFLFQYTMASFHCAGQYTMCTGKLFSSKNNVPISERRVFIAVCDIHLNVVTCRVLGLRAGAVLRCTLIAQKSSSAPSKLFKIAVTLKLQDIMSVDTELCTDRIQARHSRK